MLSIRLLALLTGVFVSVCLGLGLMMMEMPGKKPPESALTRTTAVDEPSAAQEGQPPAVTPQAVTPQDLAGARQRIDALVAASPEYVRFFNRLRTAFPAEYEAAFADFASRLADSRQEDSADYYVSEAVRRLRQARGILAAKADAAPLGRVFDMQLTVLKAVAKVDARLCVGFLYGATSPDFQTFAATQRPLIADMALAGIEAIASGQTKKNDRGAPTKADVLALETALAARGLGKAEIDALLEGKTPDPPIEDARMCAAGQSYFEVLRGLPEPARLRIYGLVVESMARS